MFLVGLTGGIGSGKTTVANLFAELGVTIIDTDQLARDVVMPGTTALQEIIAHFGETILDKDKQLNRRKLKEVVFANEAERRWLEKLLHPLIRARMQQLAEQATSAYCIAVIPLLTESKPNPLINSVLVVDAEEHLQIKRTQQRDQLSQEQIKAIMQSQNSREQRLQKADGVIYNHGDLAELKAQVLALHQKYLTLAHQN